LVAIALVVGPGIMWQLWTAFALHAVPNLAYKMLSAGDYVE